jgi:hypothetical protein
MAANRIFINAENWQGSFDVTDSNLMSCVSYFTVRDGNITELFRLMGEGVVNSVSTNYDGSLRVSIRTKYITDIK